MTDKAFRMPRAREIAVAKTHGRTPMVRLRMPVFWLRGATHFCAHKPPDIRDVLVLRFFIDVEAKPLPSPELVMRRITYLGAETQLTCRLNITDLVDADLFPHGTRRVHARWGRKTFACAVDLSRAPEGPQYPSWVAHHYHYDPKEKVA